MLWAALHFPGLQSQALARGHAPPEAGRQALAAVATWLGQFTPRVTLEPPDGMAAEVQGSLRLFGGVGRLRARLRAGLAELGFEASVAFATTALAALWRAAGGGSPLEELPVAVTGLEHDALELVRGLGIRTVGELMRLPRDGVALRFGRALLAELDRALGEIPEPRRFFVPPARFAARLELPAPVTQAESVLFAARRLLVQLEGFLAARQAGVRGFLLAMTQGDAKPALVAVNLAAPAREAAHFLVLVRERLQRVTLASPVDAIRLEADEIEPLPGATAALFRDARAAGEDWTRLVERLAARLGGGAVHGLAVHPEHRPERAWRRTEPGAKAPAAIDPPGPRPLWLLETPRRLEEGDFALLAGPERIESGWWDGSEARRDYYIARSGDGSLAWIFRAADGWYQHGIFA
ncbi:MAG: Y-family DNA polymerase [Burkholderiales bacterium]